MSMKRQNKQASRNVDYAISVKLQVNNLRQRLGLQDI